MTYQSSIHPRSKGRGFLERCYKQITNNLQFSNYKQNVEAKMFRLTVFNFVTWNLSFDFAQDDERVVSFGNCIL